jgi:PAS domain S-box-containing protein
VIDSESVTQPDAAWWTVVDAVCGRVQTSRSSEAASAIHYALRRIARAIPADRGFIHLFEVGGRIAMSFEWREPEAGFTGPRTDALAMDEVRPRLDAGETVRVGSRGSASAIMSPLRMHDRCIGVLGFEGDPAIIADVPEKVLSVIGATLTTVFLRMDDERRARQRLLEVSTLDRLYQETEQCDSIRGLLAAGAQVALESFGCDGVAVIEAPDDRVMRLLYHSGLEPERIARLQTLEEDRRSRLIERWHRFAVSTFSMTDQSSMPTTASIDTGTEAWVSLHGVGNGPAWLILRQSSFSRDWTVDERWLMAEMGRRLSEALSHLRSRQEHLAREDRYREVLMAIPELVLIFDASSRLIEVCAQPEGLEALGAKAVGCMVAQVFEEHRAIHATIQEALRTDAVRTLEFRQTVDGKVRTFSAQARRFVSDRREAVLWVARDVTEERRLEHRLLQAERLESVGRLAGGVAHDFNNLLTAILGSVSLGRSEVANGGSVLEDLRHIEEAADRGARLSRQLLAFARQDHTSPEAVQVDELLVEMDRLLRRLMGEHIELVCLPGAPGARVMIDRGQLEQVIMNLVLNGRDAMPHGGTLTAATSVALAADGDRPYVELRVIDQGEGISEANLPKIFDPFFTTKEPGRGTGLGLSTAYGIVSQHGGRIEVERTGDSGTTFRVRLPAVSNGDADTAATEDLEGRDLHGSERILVVEDEDSVRRIMTRALSQLGYEVLEARTGSEAIRRATECRYDIHLLVTDIVMPKMSGTNLSSMLVESRPEMRCLFISGYGEESEHLSQRNPRVAFLAKPFGPHQLACKVRALLDR